MRSVTANFLAAVGSSHHTASRVRVLTTPGQYGTNPGPVGADGKPQNTIPVEKWSITFDSTAQIQATLDLTTTQSWPVNYQDLLAPYGNEVFVEKGVVYGGGSTEWVSMGYYRINEPEQEDAPKGTIALTCVDRMAGIIDGRITAPITFAVGTTVTSIITSLVTDVYPLAQFAIDASLTGKTINAAQTTTQDRYGFINDLVTSYGMVWYWDYRGYLVVKPLPALASPVATLKTGRGGVVAGLSRNLSREGVYNGCVASAQSTGGTGDVPYAVVVDNDPASPTYWGGKFGKVPQLYSSSFLQTYDQCVSAATSIMQKSIGLPYEVDFQHVPNPALELYDPVWLKYARDTRQELHTLKQMVISSDPTMTAQTRQLVNGAFHAI